MTTARIELMTRECVELLQTASIGRMCIIEHGYPLAIPINYRLVRTEHGARAVVRTAPYSSLGRYEGPASLEVDDVSMAQGKAWSVIVRGNLRRVHGEHELPDPHPLLDFGRDQWMVLEPSAWSGRRFIVQQSDDGQVVDWQMAPA